MMKRIIPLVLTMCLLVFYCVSSSSPVYASELTVQQVNDLIAPLSLVNSFTVYAFAVTSNTTVSTSNITVGQTTYYNHAITQFCGFRVTIPPSTVDGYITTFGINPAFVNYTSGTPAWVSAAYDSVTSYYPPVVNYHLSSLPSYYPKMDPTNVRGEGNLYPGYVFIPAHNDTLYLFVYSSVINYNTSMSGGVVFYSGAAVQFVPETAHNYFSTLTGINSNISDLGYKLTGINNSIAGSNTRLSSIASLLETISASVSKTSPMEQFESDYLEKFGDQISKAEEALSSSNPALPNGGDIGGFVSDISEGLGLNGSAFSASDFSNALGGYSGSGSVSSGGPWEFFSQAVADSLSGDVASASDGDDDYIYQWYEQIKERFGNDRFGSVIE